MKLLQFKEDVRPAYYGTFTKQSSIVSGRRPFSQDVDKLDYDVDSEAEWEPEGEGEDIHSGDEDEEDPNTDMIDPEDVSCIDFFFSWNVVLMACVRRVGSFRKVIYQTMKVWKKERDLVNHLIHRIHPDVLLCVRLYWAHSLKERTLLWKMR